MWAIYRIKNVSYFTGIEWNKSNIENNSIVFTMAYGIMKIVYGKTLMKMRERDNIVNGNKRSELKIYSTIPMRIFN